MKNNRLYFVIFVIAFAVNVSAMNPNMDPDEENNKPYLGMTTRKRKRDIENEKNEKIETERNLKKLKKCLPSLFDGNKLEKLHKSITGNTQNGKTSVIIIEACPNGKIKIISDYTSQQKLFESIETVSPDNRIWINFFKKDNKFKKEFREEATRMMKKFVKDRTTK